MRDLYQEGEVVYRIWDPVEGKFCCSGRSLYASNGRSMWLAYSGAALALKYMPDDIRDRLVIKEFELVEFTPGVSRLAEQYPR